MTSLKRDNFILLIVTTAILREFSKQWDILGLPSILYPSSKIHIASLGVLFNTTLSFKLMCSLYIQIYFKKTLIEKKNNETYNRMLKVPSLSLKFKNSIVLLLKLLPVWYLRKAKDT